MPLTEKYKQYEVLESLTFAREMRWLNYLVIKHADDFTKIVPFAKHNENFRYKTNRHLKYNIFNKKISSGN